MSLNKDLKDVSKDRRKMLVGRVVLFTQLVVSIDAPQSLLLILSASNLGQHVLVGGVKTFCLVCDQAKIGLLAELENNFGLGIPELILIHLLLSFVHGRFEDVPSRLVILAKVTDLQLKIRNASTEHSCCKHVEVKEACETLGAANLSF